MHRILGTRRIQFALMLCVLGVGSVDAQQSLSISSGSTAGLSPVTLDIDLTSTNNTEGFVLAITFDQALLAATSLSITGGVADSVGAELAVPEIFPNGATLGVVLDAVSPFGGQVIAPGAGQLLAQLSLTPQQLVLAATATAVQFTDGVLNNPPLSNLLVQAGLSVDAGSGLGLNNGSVTLLPPPPAELTIESATIPSNAGGPVRILLSNDSASQGFVLAISHDAADVTLTSIDVVGTQTALVGAELVVPQIFPDGGTLGVVLDFTSPFGGQTLPVGANLHIANFRYTCDSLIELPNPNLTTSLQFANMQFGTPPLDNIVVVAGLSLSPVLTNGTLTCAAVAPPPPTDTKFYVGPRGLPGQIGDCFPGEEVEFCLFYEDPTDNLQGMQMALCFDCDFQFVGGSFDITGTIVDEVGAEFVNTHFDNNPNDGDGCELIVGILMDALPPFDEQMLPETATPLEIGCFLMDVSPNAACGDTLSIDFCNGINGAGSVAIENIAVINFASVQGIDLIGAGCTIVPESLFRRGDCNTDAKVDLADAATVLGQQFSGLLVQCDDACDSNDDGKINLADSVYLLNYLFIFGAVPSAPGPDVEGSDPTDDGLECNLTISC